MPLTRSTKILVWTSLKKVALGLRTSLSIQSQQWIRNGQYQASKWMKFRASRELVICLRHREYIARPELERYQHIGFSAWPKLHASSVLLDWNVMPALNSFFAYRKAHARNSARPTFMPDRSLIEHGKTNTMLNQTLNQRWVRYSLKTQQIQWKVWGLS